MREGARKGHWLVVGQAVHIHTAYDIAVPLEPTFPAFPYSAFRLVFMPAYRTLAARSSFRASEALDAGLLALVGEIIDITAVLPLAHTLVVMASFILLAHAMRVADEERADLLTLAKLDHLSCRLVPEITHPPFATACHFGPCAVQFLPTP